MFKPYAVVRQDSTACYCSGLVNGNSLWIRHLRYVCRADSSVYVIVSYEDGRIERWNVSKNNF